MDLANLTRQQLQAGLQAVLELHKPDDYEPHLCEHCNDKIIDMYINEHPCPTRQVAENAINKLGGNVDDLN